MQARTRSRLRQHRLSADMYASPSSSWDREQLPAVGIEIEDEVDELVVRALLVFDSSHKHRLLHAAAGHFAGCGMHFFRMGQQFAIRTGALNIVQLNGGIDASGVEELTVQTVMKSQLPLGFVMAYVLRVR